MIKAEKQHTIRRGGKLFRLFLFLLLLPCFGYAQLKVHYSSENLNLNWEGKQIIGTVLIEITNTSTKTVDSLTFLYWPQAYEPGSRLDIELLEDQNAKLHFHKKTSIGYRRTYLGTNTDAYRGIILDGIPILDKEITTFYVGLKPGESIEFTCFLNESLPSVNINGYGFDANSIQLSHWLPEIAGDQNVPITNSRNRESWTVPATYDFDLQFSSPLQCISNLNCQEIESGKWHFSASTPKRDALLVFLKNASEHKMDLGNATISLYFSGNFPPFNQYASWEKISTFLKDELDYLPLENPKLVFINKKGLQSAGNVYLLDESKEQEDLEGDIVEQIVSVIALEKLNINPAQHPWLVEGLANYYKDLYFQKKYPDKKLLGPFAKTPVAKFFDVDHYPVRYQNRMLFLYMSRQGLDQPLSDPSNNYSRANREAVIKGKSSMVFSYMRNYTGERNFKRSMKYWLNNTSGENGPEDLVNALRYYHNQDLSWFLGDLYSTNKKLDYKLKKTEHCSSVYTATIKNKGDLNIPFPISGYKNGTPLLTEWNDGFAKKKTIQIHLEDYEKVKIDAQESLPEYTQKNNTVKTKGLFKTLQPIKLQFYTSFENPNKTQIFWLPSVKYNAYDKFLLGAQFYNTNLFRKPFEYKVSPEYSTGTGSLTGAASFRMNWVPTNSMFHLISFGVYGKYYHYAEDLAFFRFSPTLTLNFKKSSPRSEWIRTLRLRSVAVDRELPKGNDVVPPNLGSPNYQVIDLQFKAEKGSLLSPIIALADVQYSEEFAKISGEYKQRWRLSRNHVLTARVFGGLMFQLQDTPDPYFSYGLSGTNDYLFDYYLLGRSDQSGIWSQQFFVSDGGFKSQTNVFSDKSMAALNVNVPFFRFFGAFGDVAMYNNAQSVAWDYGLYVEFIPDFIEIYFPIQNNFGSIIEQPEYHKQIRFVLNLEFDAIINRVRRGLY